MTASNIKEIRYICNLIKRVDYLFDAKQEFYFSVIQSEIDNLVNWQDVICDKWYESKDKELGKQILGLKHGAFYKLVLETNIPNEAKTKMLNTLNG